MAAFVMELGLWFLGLFMAARLLGRFICMRSNRRTARTPCLQCGQRFGGMAAETAVSFWDRLGKGIVVMDGPLSRYCMTKVVRCGGCGDEFVFDAFGGLMESFRESAHQF